MRARIVSIAAAVLVLSVLARAATARHQVVTDANDAKGPLDVKKVENFGNNRPGWKVVTYKEWQPSRLYTRGNIYVWLDTKPDERFDYYIVIFATQGGKLKGLLYRDYQEQNDHLEGRLDVWRDNKRSASVRVRLDDLIIGDRRTTFRWRVQTTFVKDACKVNVCFDFAPNSGAIEEPLP